MPKYTATSIDRAPPKPTKRGAKWAELERMLHNLPSDQCVLLEPESGEEPKAMRRGLGPVAKRCNFEVRLDPDGRRVWLVPKGVATSSGGVPARPLDNGRTPVPSVTGR